MEKKKLVEVHHLSSIVFQLFSAFRKTETWERLHRHPVIYLLSSTTLCSARQFTAQSQIIVLSHLFTTGMPCGKVKDFHPARFMESRMGCQFGLVVANACVKLDAPVLVFRSERFNKQVESEAWDSTIRSTSNSTCSNFDKAIDFRNTLIV